MSKRDYERGPQVMRRLFQPGDRTPDQVHAARVDPDFMLERMTRGGSHWSEMPNRGGGTRLVLLPTAALIPPLPVAFLCLLSLPPPITTLPLGKTSMAALHPPAREKHGVVVAHPTGE